MYLAGILGLCALLYAPASGRVSGRLWPSAPQEVQPQSSQPVAQEAPKPDPRQPGQLKSDASQAGSREMKPADDASANRPKPQKPASITKRKTPSQKNTHAPASQDAKKKVVRRGGTAEPTTQLSPGITEEQAARQRQTTTQLLSSTDVALQKLAVRQLSNEQKETVAQIRKFMEQAKAADADGDPQRSYKLALKAHLLTDALDKQ